MHCAEKIVSVRHARRFCVSRKGGTGGGGWLLGLAVKVLWLGPGGPIPALAAWTGLEDATLTL